MKKKLLYLSSVAISLLFTGCGGESSTPAKTDVLGVSDTIQDNDSVDNNPISEVNMKIGVSYMIQTGESIIQVSTTPTIVIETNTSTGSTTAKLLDGEAVIKKETI